MHEFQNLPYNPRRFVGIYNVCHKSGACLWKNESGIFLTIHFHRCSCSVFLECVWEGYGVRLSIFFYLSHQSSLALHFCNVQVHNLLRVYLSDAESLKPSPSRHHRGTINGPSKTPLTSRHYDIQRLSGAPEKGHHLAIMYHFPLKC